GRRGAQGPHRRLAGQWPGLSRHRPLRRLRRRGRTHRPQGRLHRQGADWLPVQDRGRRVHAWLGHALHRGWPHGLGHRRRQRRRHGLDLPRGAHRGAGVPGGTPSSPSPRSCSRTSASPTPRRTRGRCQRRATSRLACRQCGGAARAGAATIPLRRAMRTTATCASTLPTSHLETNQWRAFSKFLLKHPDLVPAPYEAAALAAVLDSAIAWGYNTLMRISCGNGLVSNWWSVPDNGWPWKGELKCTNSGTAAGAYYSDAARIPWRVTLDYLWFGDESRADIYDEDGKILGTWGAQEYANRWASGWKELIEAHPDASPGVYPPMSAGATPMRSDQVLPLLSDLEKCSFVPEGFTASPWNGWGAYPVVTCFQVPMSGVDDAVMQEWVEFLGQVGFDACTNKQYFDLGQEVVVSAMLGGVAWLPKSLGGAGPVRPAAVHAPRPTPTPAKAEPTDVVTTPLIVPQSQQVPTSYPPPSTSAAPTTYPEVPLPVPVPQPVPVPLPAPTEEAPSGPWNPFAAIRDAFAALIGRSELPKDDVDIATAPEEHHHHALAACVLAGAAAALLAAASALARGCAAGGRRASTQEAAGLLQARPLEDRSYDLQLQRVRRAQPATQPARLSRPGGPEAGGGVQWGGTVAAQS
ncbi:unnamed protein product, partial [Prorocentrum cordatum]